jgi:DNA-binding transcriptional LysR family regulator
MAWCCARILHQPRLRGEAHFALLRVVKLPFLQLTVMQIAEGGFDLAVRIGSLADTGSLRARALGEHGMVLCAAAGTSHASGVKRTSPCCGS